MAKTIKIGIYQGYHGVGIPQDVLDKAAIEKPDIFCLPEYFFVGQEEDSILLSASRHDDHLRYLKDISTSLECAVTGGTLVTNDNGTLKNRCYFIENSRVVDFYDKIHLYKKEGRGQITPGTALLIVPARQMSVR